MPQAYIVVTPLGFHDLLIGCSHGNHIQQHRGQEEEEGNERHGGGCLGAGTEGAPRCRSLTHRLLVREGAMVVERCDARSRCSGREG